MPGKPSSTKDGKKLFVIAVQPRAELVRYDSKAEELVPYLGGISAGDVDFSKDGKWVTYVSYPENVLWRSKVDGIERLQLTYSPMQAALAHWSPDGQQIVFSGTVPGKPWKVFLVSKDGGNPKAITTEDGLETDPTWSPDGKQLAFGKYDVLHPEKTSIQVLNLATRQFSNTAGLSGHLRLTLVAGRPPYRRDLGRQRQTHAL